jgi:hypothetical protein
LRWKSSPLCFSFCDKNLSFHDAIRVEPVFKHKPITSTISLDRALLLVHQKKLAFTLAIFAAVHWAKAITARNQIGWSHSASPIARYIFRHSPPLVRLRKIVFALNFPRTEIGVLSTAVRYSSVNRLRRFERQE